MGLSYSHIFSEYSLETENNKIAFEEDCLITNFPKTQDFKPTLETIEEEKELDAYSSNYVNTIFNLEKDQVTNEFRNNFDICYPISLGKYETKSFDKFDEKLDYSYTYKKYIVDYYDLKEKYEKLQTQNNTLQKRYDSLKHNFDLVNKRLKQNNIKYKFD